MEISIRLVSGICSSLGLRGFGVLLWSVELGLGAAGLLLELGA